MGWTSSSHFLSFHSLAIFLSRVFWCRWGRKIPSSSLMTDYDEGLCDHFQKRSQLTVTWEPSFSFRRNVVVSRNLKRCMTKYMQESNFQVKGDAWQHVFLIVKYIVQYKRSIHVVVMMMTTDNRDWLEYKRLIIGHEKMAVKEMNRTAFHENLHLSPLRRDKNASHLHSRWCQVYPKCNKS